MSFLLAGTTIERDIGLNPYPELMLTILIGDSAAEQFL